MELITLGTIIKTSGTKGAMKLKDALSEIYLPAGSPVFIGYTASSTERYTLQNDFYGSAKATIQLEQISAPEAATALIEKAIFVPKDFILKENPDYIFEDEILGCAVLNSTTGELLGHITEVWYMPANNVWVLQSAAGNIPLPVIDDVIIKTDLKNKKIWINLLEGLADTAF